MIKLKEYLVIFILYQILTIFALYDNPTDWNNWIIVPTESNQQLLQSEYKHGVSKFNWSKPISSYYKHIEGNSLNSNLSQPISIKRNKKLNLLSEKSVQNSEILIKSDTELKELSESVSFWYQKFKNVLKVLREYIFEDDILENDEVARSQDEYKYVKVKKRYKKLMLPLLIAYKLKFFTLIPVLIGGLVLLAGSTGLAGFFFALFAAAMGIKGGKH